MRTDIDNLAQPGFTPDPPELASPGSAWTDTRNVRRAGCPLSATSSPH
jgi:hypothetical protein